jgi:hypothetical protein
MKTNIYRILEPKTPPKTSGKGEKGLLISLQSSDKEENMATLEGLVKAIKLDIEEDVTIVSMDESYTSLNSLIANNKYSTIILVGITADQIGFTINAQPYFFYKMEGFSILLTDSLSDMNADKAKKMKFWQNLQSRFLA